MSISPISSAQPQVPVSTSVPKSAAREDAGSAPTPAATVSFSQQALAASQSADKDHDGDSH